jgi:hypothetical protein
VRRHGVDTTPLFKVRTAMYRSVPLYLHSMSLSLYLRLLFIYPSHIVTWQYRSDKYISRLVDTENSVFSEDVYRFNYDGYGEFCISLWICIDLTLVTMHL